MTDEHDREIEASWRVNAQAWAELVRDDAIESRKLATNAAIVQAVLEQGPERVLDVGCGEGWLARTLASTGIEVIGFDSSPDLIQSAQHAGGAHFLELGYQQFIDQPDRVGRDFDVVVCNFSILGDNLTDLAAACGHVLSAHGRLIVQTVHPFADSATDAYEDGWRLEHFAGFGGALRAPMPWYFRTVASWVNGITAAGLRIAALREPLHPHTARPLSLLLSATHA